MENTPHIVHSHTYAPYPYTVRELDRFFVVRADPNAHLPRTFGSDLPGSKIGAITLLLPRKPSKAAFQQSSHAVS